jgi:hypothetical protein
VYEQRGLYRIFAPATFAHDVEMKAVVLDPAGDAEAEIEAAAERAQLGRSCWPIKKEREEACF